MAAILIGWQCIFSEIGSEFLKFNEPNLRLQKAKLYSPLVYPLFHVRVILVDLDAIGCEIQSQFLSSDVSGVFPALGGF